ncbi:cyclic diguanosine monophosphate-binding protein [Neiella marina]|uniref:Cyclic diguanosine monophosphate-binding protein n=1 Tax=Neiella marina TaxID=508461 RepID=A0A8J2XLR0_9GAMM|nr:PilZ domain-containing protein [Neiella marina]GGA71545.1 cyclic diguanosine monophosphate-binding protein [Neiella marina]
MTTQDERRKFFRIVLDWPVEVVVGEVRTPAVLIDLSFKGLLLHSDTMQLPVDEKVDVEVHNPESDSPMSFKAHVVRASNGNFAMQIDAVDIDTMSELRRTIELNIGNDALLQRNLEQLLQVS